MNKLLPRRWQKQPQTPVEIDWSHPLAKGLTGLWIFNRGQPVNLVTGEKSVGSYTRTVNKDGIAYKNSGSTTLQLAASVNSLIKPDSASIYILGSGADSAAINAYYASGSVSTTFFGLLYEPSISMSGIGAYFGTSSNASHRIISTISPALNRKNILATFSPTRKAIYSNGLLNVEETETGNSSVSIGSPFTIFRNSTEAFNTHFNAIATWNRALTAKEAAEASRNIYQLLRPSVNKLYPDFIPAVIDVDLPFPAPVFNAEMAVVEENQILFDIDLTTSAPSFNASLLKGEVIPIDLPLQAPDIFLNIGQVNRFSMALPMPSVGINMTMDTGILIPISLPLPVPEIESDLIAGQLLNLNLDLPVFDISLGFGEGFAFDVPAPTLEADIRVGNVVSFGLDMPTPNLAIELATERALNIEMPMPAFNLEMAFITGNVVEFALDMPAPPFSATVLSGLSMDIALDTSIPDLQAQFGLDGYIDFAFTIPAPMLQADFSSNITSATGRFFNRWTR